MRYGPYALIVPVMASGVFRFVVYWSVVRLPLGLKPEFHKWSALLRDSFGAFGTQFNQLVVAQGDFLLLGFLLPAESTLLGYFAFAFSLSTAVMASLVVNLGTVMFPALSTIVNDPCRQTEVFLRASRRIAVVGMPLCLLQGAAAAPLLHYFYQHKWDEAIPPLQILSVCMAIRVACLTNYALFSAQRRFRYQFVLSSIYALLFLGVVAIGAQFRTAIAVAWAESIYFVIYDNFSLYLAIRHGGGKVRDILKLYSVPALASAVAAGTGLWAGLVCSDNGLIQTAVMGVVTAIIYIPIIRVFDRPTFDEIVNLAQRFLPRRRSLT
jgi:O-antigen/teichoic acid export membrane protein